MSDPSKISRLAVFSFQCGLVLLCGLALLYGLAVTGPIGQARALTVFDPANYAQNLLTATHTLQTLENQIRQLANEAQMLLNMEKNLASLGRSLGSDLAARLTELRRLLDQAGDLALRIEQVDETYARLFPEAHAKALTMDKMVRTARERWEHRVGTFRLALGLQAKVLDNIETDRHHLDTLLQQSAGAVGVKSAIQAGNELIALNVKQLLQLQTLLATQARANTLEQAERAAGQQEARVYLDSFMGKWGR